MDETKQYDAIVIGVGTAGGSVIWSLHRAGLKVAAIEKDLVGGLCAYWGCIPSKTLLRPGGIEWEAHHGFGVSEPQLDWPEIARYRNWMVRDWNDGKQVAQTVERFGRLDILVNNSGIETKIPFLDYPLDTYRHIIDVDLTDPWICSKLASRRMVK